MSNPIARMLRAAASGIVLALGFVHVLPHGMEEFGNLALHVQLDPYYNPAGEFGAHGVHHRCQHIAVGAPCQSCEQLPAPHLMYTFWASCEAGVAGVCRCRDPISPAVWTPVTCIHG
eukprot:1160260-Pelagomonas_calceolata.AAC.5